jgi:hypothetical protein
LRNISDLLRLSKNTVKNGRKFSNM